ncbi:hypothetical protein NB713_003396 [Xanthomonas sacchari]|nr:hypothetical protein [Xanthomonas sacchari]
MHLQHRAVDRAQHCGQCRTVQPGGQGGDAQRQVGRQRAAQLPQQRRIGGQPRGGAVVVDLHAAQCHAGGAPSAHHVQHLGVDAGRVQLRQLPVQPHHRDHRAAIGGELPQIHRGGAPAGARMRLQREYAQRREVRAGLCQHYRVRATPLPLPDVDLVLQRRRGRCRTATKQQTQPEQRAAQRHDGRVRTRAATRGRSVATGFSREQCAKRGSCAGDHENSPNSRFFGLAASCRASS